ncbi:shikimate dehydrogenase [Rhodospirillales bacterium]|nr:shikimate dehydrogenase [Rhodospirillales bacterium]MDA8637517.1 shikimate dehydrogenase [Rhodospirillales bacterium]
MISGAAKIAGVIGWPIAHSLSPRLHGFWLDHHGVDGAYIPMPVSPDHIEMAIAGLSKLGLRGANVTVPHKIAAFNAADELSPAARAIGAVNTLVCRDDGSIFGDNTDGYGFLANLKAGAPDWDPSSAPALVLGAGGAARGVIWSLIDAGVPRVMITNRTAEKAQVIADDMDGAITVIPWDDRSDTVVDAGLIVNTTSLGMTGKPALDVNLDHASPSTLVTDIVYAPLETPLLKDAAAHGCQVVDGLGMLLHQAVPGFEAWFGIRPEVTPELRAHVLAGLAT